MAALINYAANDLKMELGENHVKRTGYSRSMEPRISRVPPYHQVVEKIASVNPDDDVTEEILRLIAESYGMSHVAYLGLHLPMKEQKLPLVQVTYPESWVDRYVEKGYVKVDPVINTAMKSLLPTDWASLKSESKLVKQLFGEAREFGVGAQGLTFPIRGAHGERALFSIVGNFSDREWAAFKRENLPHFNVLAFHVHDLVIKKIGAPVQEVKLSPRECECLKWAAQEKPLRISAIYCQYLRILLECI